MKVVRFHLGFLACAVWLASGCTEAAKPGNTGGASGANGIAGTAGNAGTAGTAGTVGTAGTAGTAGAAGMGGQAGVVPAATPSWAAIYENVFVRAGCNGPGLCHGGTAGMLQMLSAAGTHAAMVGVAASGENADGAPMPCKDSGLMRVVPGSPEQSLLMMKLDGAQTCGLPMPPVGGLLTDDERALVRTWIMQGALNN